MRLMSIMSAIVVAGLLALPGYAQIGEGGIRGRVLDREGKPLQGATIRVEHLTTHQTDDTKSGRSGDYSITGLFQGTYKVSLIVDNRVVMVQGEGTGNAIQVANGTDANVSFDMRKAPATPLGAAPAAAVNLPAPKNDKEREAQKKAMEETKEAFAAGLAAAKEKKYDEAVKQFQLAGEKDPTQP